jgi:outer membrane protein assembly factor BamB
VTFSGSFGPNRVLNNEPSHNESVGRVPCTDGLVTLTVAEDARSFTPLWRSATFDAGPPIVAGGVIWTVDLSVGALVGLDEANGHELVREKLEKVSHFASPSSAGGCLFVPTLQTITAFCSPA